MEKRLFRRLTGKNLDDIKSPKLSDIKRQLDKELTSHHPLRRLGTSQEGAEWFTEEDRENHIHILGGTREGKSKFLEHLIRQDINRGYGACLLDPSDNGDTAYKILRYCARIGFEKVCLIDPHHRYGHFATVPCINPLREGAPPSAVIGDMMDTIRTLWGTKDFAETARIQKYLPAVIYTLQKGGYTLHESLFFTDHTNRYYTSRRMEMLEHLHPADRYRIVLEEVFRTRNFYLNEFASTIRRIEPFLEDTMKLIFGGKDAIDFTKMVSEGWLILCNLDPQGLFGQEHQRLIGTAIINEITVAIHRLREHGWKGRYYLYVDEVGQYATPKLQFILDHKAKSGLILTMAHQGFDQVSDSQVLSAIYRGAKIKVLFNTKDPSDQKKMIAMMYGGELNSENTRYTLMNLKKQHAVVKVNKEAPVTIRIPDIPDVDIAPDVLTSFISKLYRQEWYHHPKAVLEEINARFKPQQSRSGVDQHEINPPQSVKAERPHDGNSDVKTQARKSTGRSVNLPAKSKAQNIPASFVHDHPQDVKKP